ncbi:MAG: di-trans,poly-cis-decaprenylcistransferase [Verrucomicrobia bacterium]|nr:MAG: di-trans,poly-cis-decaprenylcistransferase [Verrucomicrobiota bacterium]
MDGNGRWARARGLPRIEGHRRGSNAVREALQGCRDLGIRYLTLYAFSSENWRRPQDEVSGLLGLLATYLKKETAELVKNRVRLRVIGRPQDLPENVQQQIRRTMEKTAAFTEHTLTLALSYGSRQEVIEAIRAYAREVAAGREDPDTCSWEVFRRYLYTRDMPDPDLIIRTSGESRLSNFLMLQAAYSELYFTPVLWPDFTREHLFEAVEAFRKRERRYGMTGDQLRDASTPAT